MSFAEQSPCEEVLIHNTPLVSTKCGNELKLFVYRKSKNQIKVEHSQKDAIIKVEPYKNNTEFLKALRETFESDYDLKVKQQELEEIGLNLKAFLQIFI